VTVRLICATNKTLLQEVEKGTFRHDLFYRLNVLSIITPPLRDHLEDLPLLFRHFLEKLSFEQGCKLSVEPEVIEYLKGYQWPGNVRELQNIVERAASLAENGVITMWHLPQALYAPVPQMMISSSKDLQIPVKRKQRQEMAGHTEKLKIISLLNTCAGNVSRVAKELGISRKTLYNKMRLYSIQN
ncbi:MAG TPA: helix-turn-helix domain-containing protein, partial [Negativicutes bacterium]